MTRPPQHWPRRFVAALTIYKLRRSLVEKACFDVCLLTSPTTTKITAPANFRTSERVSAKDWSLSQLHRQSESIFSASMINIWLCSGYWILGLDKLFFEYLTISSKAFHEKRYQVFGSQPSQVSMRSKRNGHVG